VTTPWTVNPGAAMGRALPAGVPSHAGAAMARALPAGVPSHAGAEAPSVNLGDTAALIDNRPLPCLAVPEPAMATVSNDALKLLKRLAHPIWLFDGKSKDSLWCNDAARKLGKGSAVIGTIRGSTCKISWTQSRTERKAKTSGTPRKAAWRRVSLPDGRRAWLVEIGARGDGAGKLDHERRKRRAVERRLRQTIAAERDARAQLDTAQRRAEDELRRARAAAEQARTVLTEALESTSEGFALYGADDRLIVCNGRYRSFYPEAASIIVPGVAVSEVIRALAEHRQVIDTIDDLDDYVAARLRSFRDAEPVHEERLADGRTLRITRRRTASGNVVAILADISDLKRTEENLRLSRRTLRSVVNAIPAAISVKDRALTYTYTNQYWSNTMGVPMEQARGLVSEAVYNRPDRSKGRDMDLHVLATGETVPPFEERGAVPGHEPRDWLIIKAPIKDSRGNVTHVVTVSLDISDRRRAEEELREARRAADEAKALLDDAVENMSEGFIVLDRDRRIVRVNRRYLEMMPFLRSRVRPGVHVSDIFEGFADELGLDPGSPERQGYVDARVAIVHDAVAEYELPVPGGRTLVVTRHLLSNGGSVGLLRDVTERRRAERELTRERAILRATLDSIDEGITVYDAAWRLIAYNRFALELQHLTAAECYGNPTIHELRDIAWQGGAKPVHTEIEYAELDARTRNATEPFRFERERADGTIIEVYTAPTDDGGFVRTYKDITVRRRYELELAEKTAILEGALDQIDDGFAVLDSNQVYILTNRAYVRNAGIPPDFIKPRQTSGVEVLEIMARRGDFGPGDPLEQVRQRVVDYRQHLQLPPEHDTAIIFERRTPEERTIETRATRLPGVGRVLITRDLTDTRRAAEELRQARDAAEAANRAKSQFLATMSHEIRTPMNGVIGVLELLSKTRLDAEQQELAAVIAESATALLKIIDDILDVSKIEAGKLEIERVPVELVPLVEGVADTLASQAQRKQLSLVTFIAPDVPAAIWSDSVRLRQILFNLLGNAIKFTSDGHVSVEVTRRAGNGSTAAAQLRFEISDTGIGLDETARHRLFQPFVQADSSTTRRFGGTGLGLSICRRLVELMGGEIGVDSEPGRGSTFWFTLPVSAAPVLQPDGVPNLARQRVLVVEDDALTRKLLRAYLSNAGAEEVSAVSTGAEALTELTRAARAGRPFDAAVIDHRLPDMTGDAIVATFEDGVSPRYILLTAFDSPGQRQHLLSLGFSRYLTKPVRRAALLRAVLGLEDEARSSEIGSDAAAPLRQAPDRQAALEAGRLILVAEDNATNRMLVSRQLNHLGFVADLAEDGQVAFDKFGTTRYGLIITDCHMPNMDGFELTAAIRRREGELGTPRMPIIAMTANALEGESERCMAAGMDWFLPKPVTLAHISGAVSRWFPTESPGESPDNSKPAATAQSGPAAAVHAPPIDFDGFRQLVGLAGDQASEFLRQFVAEHPAMIDDLARAVSERRRRDAAKLVHAVKGVARTIMANELAGLFADVEAAIKRDDWDGVDRIWPAIRPAFDRIEQFVAGLR